MYAHGCGTEQNYELAIKWLHESIENGCLGAYNELAWTYHLINKYDDALPWAEKAIVESPDNPNYIDTLATVYQGLGRYNEAMEQFELCLKLYQDNEKSEEGIRRTEDKINKLKALIEQS